MTPPGPNPGGDGLEDPSWGGSESPGDDFADDALKGWVAPEERSWRHPSEVFRVHWHHGDPLLGDDPGDLGEGHYLTSSPRPWAMGLVGAGAVAAVVVGAVLMNTIGTDGRDSLTSSVGPTTTTVALISSSAASAEESLVTLQITSANGTTLGCAVAVAQGGLIATTADAVLGASSIFATTWSGRHERAKLVAVDRPSDVALLRLADDVPVPRFTDDVGVNAGHPAMVVSIASSPGVSGTVPVWATSTIDSVSSMVQGGSASGMAGIAANTKVVSGLVGALLVETNGSVMGLLDKSGSWAAGPADEVFLPAEMVLGVSSGLAANGKVNHGWLDVSGHDAPGPAGQPGPVGALVVGVEPRGAAANVLRPGDVIEAVAGEPVRSMAELRSRLYVLGPRTLVHLVVLRNQAKLTLEVELASSP